MLSEPLNVLVQIASAFQDRCTHRRHYWRLAQFFIVNNIVEEYLHYRTTAWLSSEATLSDNENYLNDSYDFWKQLGGRI